ncbi:hypothetical protein [Streptomyces sp. SP18CS02]|uniref:hypothetical protein n=1 Tax=Streptomyces sp. SP18CS02 TaxID=3002531 RepID=UPI002E76F4E2|nr:hypothetical protein [Streptomyces sp. SP18CS02]MEE1757384.1 hypothetical protein [Streptomyces sp. SP18CS02]
MDELKRRLREAAHAHHPDRARILARVERGRAAPADPAPVRRTAGASWLRVVGATAAVAAVLAVGGYAVASVLHDDGPATAAVPPVPEDRTPGQDRPGVTPGPTGQPPVTDGYLSGEGVIDPHSNRFWAQSNLTLGTAEPLSALTVEVRVALTGGVADTGNWRSLPVEDFTVSVRERGGALVYTWVLKPDRTAPAGRHVFAGQYNHAEGGRDARADRYTITATSADGRKATVRGGFGAAS